MRFLEDKYWYSVQEMRLVQNTVCPTNTSAKRQRLSDTWSMMLSVDNLRGLLLHRKHFMKGRVQCYFPWTAQCLYNQVLAFTKSLVYVES